MKKNVTCPSCGKTMQGYTIEREYEKGHDVTYYCTNPDCKSVIAGYPEKRKVFEDK